MAKSSVTAPRSKGLVAGQEVGKKAASAPKGFNDRGPTQITVSRSVRARFRKACFSKEITMSDMIEKLMSDFAEAEGF